MKVRGTTKGRYLSKEDAAKAAPGEAVAESEKTQKKIRELRKYLKSLKVDEMDASSVAYANGVRKALWFFDGNKVYIGTDNEEAVEHY